MVLIHCGESFKICEFISDEKEKEEKEEEKEEEDGRVGIRDEG